MLCPCGSNSAFSTCCQPIIQGQVTASSPEQLMRSRYSAYALKNSAYIFQTYASETQKAQSLEQITLWAEQTKWLRLVIHQCSEFANNDEQASVEFSAFYYADGRYYKMRENSRFIMESLQWRYLDGEVSFNDELLSPKRNYPCFCNSKKKFKQCCAI